jgi:hypothetical protein
MKSCMRLATPEMKSSRMHEEEPEEIERGRQHTRKDD